MVNKKDDWHRERRVGEVVKAGIKCFCGSEAYRDILEVTMNGETFPCVHRIFCPNCGLQMRSPAGNDDDFIVRRWRDISDLHQHQKDAVPVVHARWIYESEGIGDYSHCSECGCRVGGGRISDLSVMYKYCPNCGAKMDGDS